MTAPTGVDQSWGYLDPATAARMGIQVVSDYISNDPSKDWTAAQIRAYHAVGIGCLLNWESDPGRPLLGAAAGRSDATAFVAKVRALIVAVGYAPSTKIALPMSCDRDVTTAQQYQAVEAYYRAAKPIVEAAGFVLGVYGEADLCDYLASRGITGMEWQTYAWSGGRVSSNADFYQYLNGQTIAGASVDFNRVINGTTVGAWWPPGHTAEGGGTPLPSTDWSDMATADEIRAVVASEIAKNNPALVKVITVGDGLDVDDAKNAHPNNLRFIRSDIATLQAVLMLAIQGDGPNEPAATDTHPNNLRAIRAGQRDVAAQVAALNAAYKAIDADAIGRAVAAQVQAILPALPEIDTVAAIQKAVTDAVASSLSKLTMKAVTA